MPLNRRENTSNDLRMDTGEKSAFVIFLVGVVALCYQTAEMLAQHTDWNYFSTPPGVGEIFFTIAVALGTIIAALYVDPAKVLDLIRT